MDLSGTGNDSVCADVCACNREREFTDVYEKYAEDIYRVCFSFMKNHMDAEDAVQETFLKFYHSEKKFESEKHRKAWLIVTASNYCKDMLKQHWRKRRSDIEQIPERAGKEEPKKITGQVGKVSQPVKSDGFVYQVTNVTVSSKVRDMDEEKFDVNVEKSLWGKDGKLNPYTRETLQMGDGIKNPVLRVVGTQKIQPKMVYVTMKVKSEKNHNTFELPDLIFAEKEGKEYYQTRLYENYNRPAGIEDAFMDGMPCYFKETSGGTGFLLKEMNGGEEAVYHFAYLMDEDMTDNIFLRLGINPYKLAYIDLSK